MNPCTVCNTSNARACARCHSTRYWSPECQQTDWPAHRLLCSQYSAHTGRPNPSYKRAILFLPDEVKPKFIWIECTTEQDEEVPGYTWEASQVRNYLGGRLGEYDASPERKLIGRNPLRGRSLVDALEVICRSTFAIDGSTMNKGIIKATHGDVGYAWKGPILAMKLRGRGMDPRFYTDIDLQDYRDVVEYFMLYGTDSVQDGEVARRYRKGKVRGVKINCKGDQRTSGVPEFSPVEVPKGHPVFYDDVAHISRLVGMPLRARKYPPDRLWKDEHENGSYENVPATFLHLNADDMSDRSWGWAPLHWQNGVGSVLVVRADLEDVTTEEVKVLCRFCQFKMQPIFENALGGGLVQMERAEVMAYLTPDGFRDYFEDMRGRGMEEDEEESWRSAGQPVRGS